MITSKFRLINNLQERLGTSHIITGSLIIIGFVFFRPMFAIALLTLIGAFSIFYKRYISIGLDFELCTFCAVVIGTAYGGLAGALSGGIAMLTGLILNGHMMKNPFFGLIKVITIMVLGALVVSFPGKFLVIAVTAFTFVADLIFVIVAANTGGNIANLAVFQVTHPIIIFYQMSHFFPMIRTIV